MKKNVLRGLIFLTVAALLFCGLNLRYVRSDYFYSRELFMHFEDVPRDIEVARFGSSHGQYAVDFSQLTGRTGFNFGVPGQTPNVDKLMFESYMNHFSDDCVVIISLSYFSLYLNFEGTYTAQKPLYYRYLNITKLPEYSGYAMPEFIYFQF